MSRRLTAVFASNDAPLAITGLLVSAVSGLLAAGLCTLFDERVVAVSLVIAALLGFVAASAPMFMALRLILLAGLLLTVSATLGTVLQHGPLIAALVMAAIAFVTAIWTGVPVVGGIFSSLPSTVFILLLAKGDSFAKEAPAWAVALAALLAMVPPVALAIALSIRDPRKYDRAMTAALWDYDSPNDKRDTYSRVLLLDGAPVSLLYLAAYGSVGLVCRGWLDRNADMTTTHATAARAQADANAAAIAAALPPKGPLTPRPVAVSTDAMVPAAAPAPATNTGSAAWSLWATSQRRAQAVLAGEEPTRVANRPLLVILGSMLRGLARPDVSVFRYGVQRAVALGLGAFAVAQTRGNENAFWILLTMASVLQANAPSTAAKVAQRSVGTLGGVLLAVLLSLLLPTWLLVPWVAGAAMVAGFAWIKRNYTMTAMLTGFAVVLLYGAPTDDVLRFASLRAVDVVIGGLLAALIARFVMRVKPRPAARRATLVTSLRTLTDRLGRLLAEPSAVTINQLAADQSQVSRAISDLRTDLSLMSDGDLVRAYQEDLDGFIADDAKLFTLGMTALDLGRDPQLTDLPLTSALDWLRTDIDTRAAHPPTAHPPG